MIAAVVIANNCLSLPAFVLTSSLAVAPIVNGNADETTTAGRSRVVYPILLQGDYPQSVYLP